MAYDAAGARVGAAGHFASRITAALIASGQVTKDQAMDTFADLTSDALTVLDSVESGGVVQQSPAVQQRPQQTVEQAANVVHAEFPGTTEVPAETPAVAIPQQAVPGLTVLNEQHGPLPEWIFVKAAEAGVTEVYDNRDRLASSPKSPWFRSSKKFLNAKGDQIPFWPN